MKKRHAETLYALVRSRKGVVAMIYRLAPTAAALWFAIVNEGFMGPGQTKQTLQSQGWRPRKVTVRTVAKLAP